MTVQQLIDHLQTLPPECPLYVDFDREGDNERPLTRVDPFNPDWLPRDSKAIKLS